MRIPLLRSLSGRIVLGFMVLIITFGTVMVLTVHNMGILGHEIKAIRLVHSKLTLLSKDLLEKQTDLRQYLHQDLEGESSPARVSGRVARFHKARTRILDEAAAVTEARYELTENHQRYIVNVGKTVAKLRSDIRNLDDVYAKLLERPPLERYKPEHGHEPSGRYTAGLSLLKQLQRREGQLHGQIVDFERSQRRFFEKTTRNLEENETRLRFYTLVLGITAVIAGLLITLWATFTLRPLRRLRDAARGIASGNYASRIDERGPAEVADLAREFNLMGQAIEERQRELVRSERLVAIGKMAAMITHEVRNPLSSIGLNTELLEEELAALPASQSEEARSLCRSITREVDRLTDITEEYLQFARLPKPKIQAEPVDHIISNLAEFEREQFSLRKIELEVHIEDDLPLVLVDEAQLRQSLLNLLRNAAESMEEVGGGTVRLTAERGADDTVRLSVADEGVGISEELLPKLFDPFFSTKDGGTGLGLALTHQIVREHGGWIDVDSEPGRGSTFVVVLPAAPRRSGRPPDQN